MLLLVKINTKIQYKRKRQDATRKLHVPFGNGANQEHPPRGEQALAAKRPAIEKARAGAADKRRATRRVVEVEEEEAAADEDEEEAAADGGQEKTGGAKATGKRARRRGSGENDEASASPSPKKKGRVICIVNLDSGHKCLENMHAHSFGNHAKLAHLKEGEPYVAKAFKKLKIDVGDQLRLREYGLAPPDSADVTTRSVSDDILELKAEVYKIHSEMLTLRRMVQQLMDHMGVPRASQ